MECRNHLLVCGCVNGVWYVKFANNLPEALALKNELIIKLKKSYPDLEGLDRMIIIYDAYRL